MGQSDSNTAERWRGTPGGGGFERIYTNGFDEVCRWIRGAGRPGCRSRRHRPKRSFWWCAPSGRFRRRDLPGWLYRITPASGARFSPSYLDQTHLHQARIRNQTSCTRSQNPATAPREEREPTRPVRDARKIREARRSTFILSEIEGLSGAQIYQIQGIPLKTVWTRRTTPARISLRSLPSNTDRWPGTEHGMNRAPARLEVDHDIATKTPAPQARPSWKQDPVRLSMAEDSVSILQPIGLCLCFARRLPTVCPRTQRTRVAGSAGRAFRTGLRSCVSLRSGAWLVCGVCTSARWPQWRLGCRMP